jgi:hypothetical protein
MASDRVSRLHGSIKRIQREEEKKLRDFLARDDCNASVVNERIELYRGHCDDLIFCDLQNALQLGIHGLLWDMHTSVNSWYRKSLYRLKHTPERTTVSERKLEIACLKFIKSSQRYYEDFVTRIASSLGGTSGIEDTIRRTYVCPAASALKEGPFPGAQGIIALSCFTALMHLGDLSRWREERRIRGKHQWHHANEFYELAGTIRPQSGQPHHQLGVLNRLAGGKESTTLCHLLRSATTQQPHSAALDSMDKLCNKILGTDREQSRTSNPNNGDLDGVFVMVWARIWAWKESNGTCADVSFLRQMIAQSSFSDEDLLMVVCISILLMHANVVRKDGSRMGSKLLILRLVHELNKTETKQADTISSTIAAIGLNITILATLLELAVSSMTDCCKEPASLHDIGSLGVLAKLLPPIRLCSAWLLCVYSLENGKMMKTWTQQPGARKIADELWSSFLSVLPHLHAICRHHKPQGLEYLLREDVKMADFTLFESNPDVQRRYLKAKTTISKLLPEDDTVQGKDPRNEMLVRMQDIMLDGMRLARLDDCPLQMLVRGADVRFTCDGTKT